MQFTQAQKQIVSQQLIGSRVYKTWPKDQGGLYRVYVLMELPIGPANQALLNHIKNNQNMYTRFRAKPAYEELEEEVKKYEEWKANQGP